MARHHSKEWQGHRKGMGSEGKEGLALVSTGAGLLQSLLTLSLRAAALGGEAIPAVSRGLLRLYRFPLKQRARNDRRAATLQGQRLQKAQLLCARDRLAASTDGQLIIDLAIVPLDGVDREVQFLRDLAV